MSNDHIITHSLISKIAADGFSRFWHFCTSSHNLTPVINRVKPSTLLMPLPRLQVENIENVSLMEQSFSPMNGEIRQNKEGGFSPINCERDLFKRSHDVKTIEEMKVTFTAAHK